MYFVEKTKGTNFIKQFDFPLFAAVFILSLMGIVVLMSAIQGLTSWKEAWFKQAVCLVIGIILAFVISTLDYKDFKTLGILLYVASIAMLILVLIVGKTEKGSTSWLIVPLIGSFQPSELAKVAFVLFIPMFFERIKEGTNVRKNLIKLIFYAALPIALVFLQKDVGTALVFVFAFVVMLFIYGIPYRYFFIAVGALAASAPFLWLFVLPLHIKSRIQTFLNPELDLKDTGLQVYRSKMTIGSGQLFGKGLFHGLQTQNSSQVIQSSNFKVPLKQNDFIFSVIGEEFCFVGSMIIIALIIFILFRCLYIARNSRDEYGSFIVVGIAAMFAFHFIENIGMNIGVLPVTGIPLPFISQGGSALVTNFMSVGILLSVSMRRKRTIFNSSQ
ncbi:MAG: rod shape-determining protein RodA [Ruminiclostridium sp.]|nr:rod shape-determining protein RodA [Ruminiclostridium sp.]